MGLRNPVLVLLAVSPSLIQPFPTVAPLAVVKKPLQRKDLTRAKPDTSKLPPTPASLDGEPTTGTTWPASVPTISEESDGVVKPARIKRKDLVEEIITLTDWQKKIAECETPAVVKFFQDGCRSCRALQPKYLSLAEELSGEVTFFEVNLQRARPLFTAESIRVAPSVQIYCGDVGRVSGNGLSGARMASGLRAAIKRVIEPSNLAGALAAQPAALELPLRYAGLIDALRALREAPSLMEPRDPEAPAPARLSAERLAEVTALFRYLDVRGTGHLSARDLKRWAAALVEDGSEAASRLSTVAGVAVEREPIERGVDAVTNRGASMEPETEFDLEDGFGEEEEAFEYAAVASGIDLDGFIDLMTCHDAVERSAKRPPGAGVRAAYAALDVEGTNAVPFDTFAAQLGALCRVKASADATAEVCELLEALDFERRSTLSKELFERLVVRQQPAL